MEILDLKNVTEIKKLNERAQQQNGRDGGKNQWTRGQINRIYPIWITEKIDWKKVRASDYSKKSNICVTGVSEAEEKVGGPEKYPKKMAENVLNFAEDKAYRYKKLSKSQTR